MEKIKMRKTGIQEGIRFESDSSFPIRRAHNFGLILGLRNSSVTALGRGATILVWRTRRCCPKQIKENC